MIHLLFKLSRSPSGQFVPSIHLIDCLRPPNPKLIELSCASESFDHFLHLTMVIPKTLSSCESNASVRLIKLGKDKLMTKTDNKCLMGSTSLKLLQLKEC